MENLNITIIQSDLVWEDVDKNIENFTNKLKQIEKETDLIVLPEMFATGFSMNPSKFAQALDGQIVNWLKEKASEINATITGSLIIKENGNYYNRLVWMDPSGEFQFYDKRHLFGYAGEDKYYNSGYKHLITKIDNWRIRPLICYDLRFPVWSRNQKDYDILIYIANWPSFRNSAWKTLLQARAIENQAYVIGVNRVGDDGNSIPHTGDSCVIDPQGNILSNIKPNEESVETLSVSYSELIEYRRKFPALDDADNFEIVN